MLPPLKPSPQPSPRGRGSIDRQLDHKLCSASTFSIFHPDAAVMCLHDAARDCQAEARARLSITDVPVAHGAKEFFEDAITDVRTNSWAVVFDTDYHRSFVSLFRTYGDR